MGSKVHVGIIGGAGYTGGELIRLLINHPQVHLSFIHSKSNAGNLVSEVHADLVGETDLQFTDDTSLFKGNSNQDIDLLFLCVGHGEAKKFLQTHAIPKAIKIIDLSQDFRLAANEALGERNFIYGLPELNRKQIQSAENIANPGCFATTIQLGLLPLAQEDLLEDVYTTGITGSTGAGQSLSATSHFSWRANNIQAYKTLTHQHILEITQSLNQLQSKRPLSNGNGQEASVKFIPWRGDFTRGIFISSQVKCNWSLEKLQKLFKDYYANHPFTVVSEQDIFLKQVVNTNKCLLQLEKTGSILVVHSITDNLLKGASGQAVQNMNIMMGLDETVGLKLKANYF
jgi:N-acetyl-gamma-glutamyl-phosphate reductase